MPRKNLFEEPFDDGTLDKLSIYKEYLKEWLPVFASEVKPRWKIVQIFDFFAGEGKDIKGVPGSPLIAIEVINLYMNLASLHCVTIILHLNELDKKAFELLKSNITGLADGFQIHVYNEKFEVLFDKFYPSMKDSANFLFLDQNGIKEITLGIFKKITSLTQTDFLFFISSSFFKRFSSTDEFRKYFPFEREEVENTDYFHIHRKVVEHYKSLIQRAKPYFLAPFSIKKGANIYGLVFGSNHTFGIEKFLRVAWRRDTLRGEANFDIDDENIDPGKPSLFPEFNKPSKRHLFEKNLSELILNKKLTERYDVYLYGLNEGFQMKDVNTVLRNLKTLKKIDFKFEPVSNKLHKVTEKAPIKII